MVGRSSSPHGPFFDAKNIPLMEGGGSILLEGNSSWLVPGGGTVYLNPQSGGSLLVFHAFNMSNNAKASPPYGSRL